MNRHKREQTFCLALLTVEREENSFNGNHFVVSLPPSFFLFFLDHFFGLIEILLAIWRRKKHDHLA